MLPMTPIASSNGFKSFLLTIFKCPSNITPVVPFGPTGIRTSTSCPSYTAVSPLEKGEWSAANCNSFLLN